MASRRSGIIPLSNIPTVSQLYKSGELQPPAKDESHFTPSAALNSKVALIRTSITDLEVTSIVNAANTSLLGGGGVDGAIHSAAGSDLLEECETLGGCETGSAKITSAYQLPSKYIIHAVGPVYGRERRKREGLQAELLASCYNTSLELAAEKGGSIAFSCLSTGVYGYPSDEAAEIACKTVRAFLDSEKGQALDTVVFCCFLEKDERQYKKYLPLIFPPTHDELKSSELDQDEAAENTVDPEAAGTGTLASSATDSSNHDDWVTVEKPPAADESSGTPADSEGKIEGSGTYHEPKATTDPSHASGGSRMQNNLLKDW